ncbi:MAG: ribosome alternative rescue factor ArfA [Pseudomonadales bacterium]|nr:ribosome alternative rescue factor ArfA [Pseudomonadales bacterium]
MSKKTNSPSPAPQAEVETGRGVIRDNALAALVTSKIYRSQVVKAKKGKGSYLRKQKFNKKGRESYRIAA